MPPVSQKLPRKILRQGKSRTYVWMRVSVQEPVFEEILGEVETQYVEDMLVFM